MKFSCDSCAAKYKAPDEKVAGRTLKMACRKCGETIIIRGDKVDGESTATVAKPAPRVSAPSAPPRVSKLDRLSRAESMNPGLTPSVPEAAKSAPPRPSAIWHVSINDVPVGPVTLEELLHKMESGAISEYSLVWQETFDEWRPLATVPELISLLHTQRASVPAMPARQSGLPPISERPPSQPLSAAMAPIGGPVVAPSAPMFPQHVSAPPPGYGSAPPGFSSVPASHTGSFPGFVPAPHTGSMPGVAMPSAPVVAAEPAPSRSGGFWFMLVAAGVLLSMLGMIGGYKYAMSNAEKTIAQADSSHDREANERLRKENERLTKQLNEQRAEPQMVFEEPPELEPEVVEEIASKKTTRPGKSSTRVKKVAEPVKEELSAEEKRMLEQFGEKGGVSTKNIKVGSASSARTKKEQLDSKDVNKVVNKGRKALQRCYERASRGQSGGDSVRMVANITIAPSGRVKSVKVSGNGPGGLSQCMESNVKRWRFPASSETLSTSPKFVFAPSG